LLPYGWLYKSKSYVVLSVVIPITALIVGANFPTYIVAGFMIAVEIIFSLLLSNEVRKLTGTGKGGWDKSTMLPVS
jgi:hypothetical protein